MFLDLKNKRGRHDQAHFSMILERACIDVGFEMTHKQNGVFSVSLKDMYDALSAHKEVSNSAAH